MTRPTPGTDLSAATVEETLGRIWEEVLYCTPTGIDEDFFDAGGDSLQIIELEQKIRKRFGMDIPIESLSANCTIRTLTSLILGFTGSDEPVLVRPHLPSAGGDEFPLHPGQQSLLRIEQLPLRSHLWNTTYRFSIVGPLQVDLFERTLRDMVATQPFLRCVVRQRDGEAMGLRLLNQATVEVAEYDYFEVEAEVREKKLRNLLETMAAEGFNVESGPLFACAVARVGQEEYALIFVVHHLAFDNPSMRIFFPGLFRQYAARLDGTSVQTESHSLGKVYASLPSSAPSVVVPTEIPPASSFSGARLYFTLDRTITRGLRKSAHTAATGCLAALFRQLQLLDGDGRVIVGTSLDVRKMDGLEGMVGCLLRHAELICEAEPDAELSLIVEQARVALARAMDGRSPAIAESPGRQAWRYSFVFYTDKLQPIEAGPLRVRTMDSYMGFTKRDLTMRVVQDSQAETLEVCLEYNTTRFRPDEIAAIAGSLADIARTIARTA